MSNEFSGNVNPDSMYEPSFGQKPKPLPKTKTVEEWKQEANDISKETGQTVVGNKWYTFLMVFFFLAIVMVLILGVAFVYQVSEGKFKSSVSQTVEPQIDTTVNNQYNFTSETENEFHNDIGLNATIVINELHVHTTNSSI